MKAAEFFETWVNAKAVGKMAVFLEKDTFDRQRYMFKLLSLMLLVVVGFLVVLGWSSLTCWLPRVPLTFLGVPFLTTMVSRVSLTLGLTN